MPQKSQLTLCVSNPRATVWNSSGLEWLWNFPQPYSVSEINNEEQIPAGQKSYPRACLRTVPPVADKTHWKAKKCEGCDSLEGPFPVVQEEHPTVEPKEALRLLMWWTAREAGPFRWQPTGTNSAEPQGKASPSVEIHFNSPLKSHT